MKMCLKCWRSIVEAREEDEPPNYKFTDNGHYKYECNTCGKGSNGYVDVNVPFGCLMVSRGEAV